MSISTISERADVDKRPLRANYKWLLDVAMVILILLMALICYLILALPSGEEEGLVLKRSAGITKHHFSTFEINIPDDWTGTGSTRRIFRNSGFEDAYILVAPLRNANAEDDICRNLEINESTDFYSNKMSFSYGNRTEVKSGTVFGEKVEGYIQNERTNEPYNFYGYYFNNPKSYIFALYKYSADFEDIKAVVDDAVKGLEIQK